MTVTRGEGLALGAILLAFSALTCLQNLGLPLFEGPDEPDNLAYVRFVAAEGRLGTPSIEPVHELESLGRAHMPPLWFLTMVPVFRATGAGGWEVVSALNPDFLRRREAAGRPPASVDEILAEPWSRLQFLHGRDESRPLEGAALDLRLMRLTTLGWALVALWAIWRSARLLSGGCRSLPLLAAALAAATPQLQHLAATLTMDLMLAALGCLALLQALEWCAGDGPPLRAAALAGAFAGLAALTKLNGLVLAPVLPLAWILARGRGRGDARAAAAAALAFLAIAATWYGWGWIETGHPLWTWKYQQVSPFHNPAMHAPEPHSVERWGWFAITLFLTWLADFGWTSVWFPLWVDLGAAALLLAGAIAGVLALRRRPAGPAPGATRASDAAADARRRGLQLLVASAALILAAEVFFNLRFSQPQARHLYPFLSALVVPVALGLARLRLLGAAVALHAALSVAAFPALLARLRPEGWNADPRWAATDEGRRPEPGLRAGDPGAAVVWLEPGPSATESAGPPVLRWTTPGGELADLALGTDNPLLVHRPWVPRGAVFRASRDLGALLDGRYEIPADFWAGLPAGTRLELQVIAIGPDGRASARSPLLEIAVGR